VRLFLVRHAEAAPGEPDALRPLTPAGRAVARSLADQLAADHPDAVLCSPLLRARETAEIVAPALGVPRVEIVEALRPDSHYDELVDWLRGRDAPNGDDDCTVAVVGHEPHLSGLVTWLMTGSDDARVELKKGGVCLLHFDGEPSKGAAVLRWLLTPSQTRALSSSE
jgi:phosphohistidine phosphatase